MSDFFIEGYKKGFEEGGSGKDIDDYWLSQFHDEYRVGYVLGFGESEFVAASPEFRYHLIGGMAKSSGVSLGLFERHHDLDDEGWDDFKKGFLDEEEDEFEDDDTYE